MNAGRSARKRLFAVHQPAVFARARPPASARLSRLPPHAAPRSYWGRWSLRVLEQAVEWADLVFASSAPSRGSQCSDTAHQHEAALGHHGQGARGGERRSRRPLPELALGLRSSLGYRSMRWPPAFSAWTTLPSRWRSSPMSRYTGRSFCSCRFADGKLVRGSLARALWTLAALAPALLMALEAASRRDRPHTEATRHLACSKKAGS